MTSAKSPFDTTFALGHFRPLTLWGGPGTVRMTNLKFMNKPIDEKSHLFAHSIEGAERVAEMGFNWVFLAYNWGYPPEIEAQDWESFHSALNHYHKVGVKVFGYIQASNCVYEGSYMNKDWYALDAWGHKIPIYRGRYFTSLAHAGWLSDVRDRVRKLAELDVDGIYFDNPWQGGLGIDVAEMPLGFIGSYDAHSKNAYAAAFNGAEIPVVLDTNDQPTRQYLRWRMQLGVSSIRDWARTARDIKPSIAIVANNLDPIVHNTYMAMGMDIESLADVQDFMLIEDFSLPRIQEDASIIANAITIGATRVRTGKTPITTIPYINGIGFDRVFQPRELKRMLAEGAALNSATVVRGSTYLYRGEYTTLLHRRYDKQQATLTAMNQWLDAHKDWLADRQPIGNLAVYHPYEAAHWNWTRTVPKFFAVCQILLQHGYALRIVGDDDDWGGVQTLIVPPGEIQGLEQKLEQFAADGGRIIAVGQARKSAVGSVLWPKWKPIPHRIPRIKQLRKAINQGAALSWRIYHRSKTVRWLSERFNLHLQTTHSPLFFMPPQRYQHELLAVLGNDHLPHVKSEYPVLLSGWQEADGTQQWHIVNYADTPQKITLELDRLVKAKIYSVGSDDEPAEVVGSGLIMTVDIAKVVRIAP